MQKELEHNYLQHILRTNKEYYDACKAAKVIVFESGERSKRRSYISNTTRHLLNNKGTPTFILSDTNVTAMKNQFYKLPEFVKRKILETGIFNQYVAAVCMTRQILKELSILNSNHKAILCFITSVRNITAKLINKIKESNYDIQIILDRSVLSSYMYYKVLSRSTLDEVSNYDIDKHYVLEFQPNICFFVKTPKVVVEREEDELGYIDETMRQEDNILYDNIVTINGDLEYVLNKIIKDWEPLVILEGVDPRKDLRIILKTINERS